MILPCSFNGTIIHGYGRGHSQIGFPTANLSPNCWQNVITEKQYGVYSGIVIVKNIEYLCVISIGKCLSFNELKSTFEIHIINFNQNIYDEEINVRITYFLREMVFFESLNSLISQIKKDIEKTIKINKTQKKEKKKLFIN